jgi:hypothetical protein
MIRKRSLRREQRLRIRHGRVAVPVAKAALGNRAVRNDAEAIITRRAAERPGRNPVHPARVPREQGRDQRESELSGDIGDRDQPSQHLAVDRLRRRLEVFPGQEHAHRVETGRGDPLEVGRDLASIELRPPAHHGTRRPAIDADAEPLCARSQAQRRSSPVACTARCASITRG